MSSPALPLSNIVDVTVLISPQAPSIPSFNHGLITGSTASSITHAQRLRLYTSAAGLLSDGFTSSSPEYLAAELCFAQSPAPLYLWVGMRDATSLSSAAGATVVDVAGTHYTPGDIVSVTQGSAMTGQVEVLTTNPSTGAVLTIAPVTLNNGTGYSVVAATNLATVNVSVANAAAANLTVTLTAVGESVLEAIENCRAVEPIWYGCMSTTAAKADHEAIALYAQSAQPPMLYFYSTSDGDALSGVAGNVFTYMKANSYDRVFGLYSTTQGGTYANNTYAGAATMGLAMGLNTGLASSYFTMWGKTLAGVAPEPLTISQVTTVTRNNGNVYLNYANAYNILTPGVVGSGKYADLIIFLDLLVAQIQFLVMDLLVSEPAVPLTDAGETQVIHAVNQACQYLQQIGFVSTGIWRGVQIINLTPGTPVPGGYLAQSYPFSTQNASDRAARKLMPIYLAIVATDAGQSLLVGCYVQS